MKYIIQACLTKTYEYIFDYHMTYRQVNRIYSSWELHIYLQLIKRYEL